MAKKLESLTKDELIVKIEELEKKLENQKKYAAGLSKQLSAKVSPAAAGAGRSYNFG